ncbi:MAG: YafY family transcriptional regulator [Candidatus Lambdaproteobacteria bacterium]|nr:YafY family transcriptional regulator [Candidatus Lambdaproteobacteria bacterium]
MRRADRLFQIVQLLRRRRITTAARLADELEVSERTIYRDVRDLSLSGVPIQGEAGVGYYLPPGFDLPALMFTPEEIAALVLGARLVRTWADVELARAAGSALGKVESALPERLKAHVAEAALFAPDLHRNEPAKGHLALLRAALTARRKVHCAYTREDGVRSSRVIQPLGLFFWGAKWTLVGWCELRDAFRHFRLDRMRRLQLLDDTFADVPGRTLQDFFNSMGAAAADAAQPRPTVHGAPPLGIHRKASRSA